MYLVIIVFARTFSHPSPSLEIVTASKMEILAVAIFSTFVVSASLGKEIGNAVSVDDRVDASKYIKSHRSRYNNSVMTSIHVY